MNERDVSALADMVSFASDAIEFLGEMDVAALQADKRTRYALIRAVELVGEAANPVSLDGRTELASLPWRETIGMRNVLIHGYDGINLEIVVNVVRDELPPLVAELTRVVGATP